MLDYILVGQGLAGSVLAYTLIRRGCRILVINTSRTSTASMAAAGLYNPVTGRKMVKTWMADALFPFLEKFYRQAEAETESRFLYPKAIYRPFLNVEEQNDWMGRSSNNQFAAYVQQVGRSSMFGDVAHDPFGGLLLQSSGYVDVAAFVKLMKGWLLNRNAYLEETFDFHKLKIQAGEVEYGSYQAQKVIFCDGPEGHSNPYFKWLPFHPVKGELLYIETEKPLELILNRGVFVLPVGNYCKVGSTYDHQDLSVHVTEAARRQLSEKLNILLKTRYKITQQLAGIRPATQDRRPFIGIHPKFKPLAVFNGLGTKGVSLAPYFAEELADLLLQGKSLTPEVDIQRYYQLYHRAIA